MSHFHTDGQAHSHRVGGGLSRRDLLKHAGVTPLALIACSGPDALLARGQDGVTLGAIGRPRADSGIWKTLRESAARMSIFDTHEHLWHEKARLEKKVDFFLLFSHYTSDDLVSAGMAPRAVADLQNPDIPLEKRWSGFAPFWPYTRTTGYGRCMLIAARDLFGIEDINERTYRLLSERISAANRAGWYDKVLKEKAKIELSVLDDLTTLRGERLNPDPRFFTIVTRFDYFVSLGHRRDLDHIEKVTGIAVHGLADLEKALGAAFDKRVAEGLAGIKTGLAYERTLHYGRVSPAEAERAFERLFGAPATSPDTTDQKVLQDYMMRRVIEQAAERRLPVQIHTGMQAGNKNNIALTNPSHLSGLLNDYRQVRFDLFHGGYPYSGEFATLAKNLPNVYPDLCWLHIIAPRAAKRLLHELIETVPANKILGFGGDFFHVEGAYAHAQMARAITAEVLAEKVEEGYLKEEEAGALLQRILHTNGKELFSRA